MNMSYLDIYVKYFDSDMVHYLIMGSHLFEILSAATVKIQPSSKNNIITSNRCRKLGYFRKYFVDQDRLATASVYIKVNLKYKNQTVCCNLCFDTMFEQYFMCNNSEN